MSRNAKIALAIVAGVLGVCLCVAVGGILLFQQVGRQVQSAVAADPTQAAEIAANIADFDVPDGYRLNGMQLMGFNAVILQPGSSVRGPMYLLMQVPSSVNMDQTEVLLQMQQMMDQQLDRTGLSLTPAGSTTLSVRGEQVTFQISEGSDADGNEFRQMSGSFTAKNGQGVIMVSGPVDSWDEKTIEQFLSSIH